MLLTSHAGYAVTPAASGEAALEILDTLQVSGQGLPTVILMDMQMPGLSGDMLARLLRSACPQAVLVCMSATRPPAASLVTFDAFILKPFTAGQFERAIAGIKPAQASAAPADGPEILNQAIYDNLAQSMPAEQLRALYDMCLDDADQRIGKMRVAVDDGDEDSFVRGAHAIKGGCGMVGASELAKMASAMETDGLPPVGNQAPLERLDQFLAASQRLRRMLDAQTASSASSDHA